MSKEIKAPCKTYIQTRPCECDREMQRIYSSTTMLQYPLMYLRERSTYGKTELIDESYLFTVCSYNSIEEGDGEI